MIDTMLELNKFQKKVMQERERFGLENNTVSVEVYMATVKKVNSDTFTVDVFISILNAEIKNVQVLMPAMSPNSGRLALPQIDSAVIIGFVSYMKPFILASVPFIDSKIPKIYKNETIEYTDNTHVKHTLDGSILSVSGNRNAKILKLDGTNLEYNTDSARYSKKGYDIKATNESLGNIEYSKVNLETPNTDSGLSMVEKLNNVKSKLNNHISALNEFKNVIVSDGLDKELILNSVSQLRTLLYNEYMSDDNCIITQRGTVLNKKIEKIADIKNAKEEDIKYSTHGNKVVFEMLYTTKTGDLSISIDEDKNMDINCKKLTLNGKEVI